MKFLDNLFSLNLTMFHIFFGFLVWAPFSEKKYLLSTIQNGNESSFVPFHSHNTRCRLAKHRLSLAGAHGFFSTSCHGCHLPKKLVPIVAPHQVYRWPV